MANSRPLPDRAVERLWMRMAEIYGYRWTSAYGEDASAGAGETWSKGLAGLSTAQLGKGLERCITSADPWPPTLPAFRALCLDVPTLAEVRASISKRERSGFMRLIWQHIDGYAFARASTDRSERMLSDAYTAAREFVMGGGELPEPESAPLAPPEASKPKPASPEVVAACKARLAEVLGREAEANHGDMESEA